MKKEDIASVIIYLIMIGAAIIVGLTAVQSVFQSHYHIKMVSYLFAIIVIIVGLLLNIIMLEVFHVLGGKAGKYNIVSFNVLGFCFYKVSYRDLFFSALTIVLTTGKCEGEAE